MASSSATIRRARPTRSRPRPPGRTTSSSGGSARTSIDGGRGLALWVVSDNLRKGAATNAVQIAEVLVERGWVRSATARGATPVRRRRRHGGARSARSGPGRDVRGTEGSARRDRRGGPGLHALPAPRRPGRWPCRGRGARTPRSCSSAKAPGFNEDRQGRPFVGRAGDLLVKLLGSLEWRREDVFITNVVKCRPPDNRDPEPDEIAACARYLHRQLEVLDPALVVTLGRHSMAPVPARRPDLAGPRHDRARSIRRPAPATRRCSRCTTRPPRCGRRRSSARATTTSATRRGSLLDARARRQATHGVRADDRPGRSVHGRRRRDPGRRGRRSGGPPPPTSSRSSDTGTGTTKPDACCPANLSGSSRSAGSARSARTCTCSSTATTSSSSTAA